MSVKARVVSLLGGAAAALFAGLVAPAALAHAGVADSGPYETCDGAVCLAMGVDNPDTWTYSGFRPYFTDWKADPQVYNVEVTQPDGSTLDAGGYDIKLEDYWSSTMSSSTYHYGAFTPSGDAAGAGLGGFGDLTGTSVYSMTFGDYHQLTIDDAANGATYQVFSTPTFVNTVVTMDGASQGYIEHVGDSAPTLLWNSLNDPGFVAVPDYLVPDDPYAGMDFDPSDFVNSGSASL